VPVAVGRISVNLYAIIDPGMHVKERAHVFQINKTIFEFSSTCWVSS
jgi:hypothetical protein